MPVSEYGVGVEIQAHNNVIAHTVGKKRNLVRILYDLPEIPQAARGIEIIVCGNVVTVLRDLNVQSIQFGYFAGGPYNFFRQPLALRDQNADLIFIYPS